MLSGTIPISFGATVKSTVFKRIGPNHIPTSHVLTKGRVRCRVVAA